MGKGRSCTIVRTPSWRGEMSSAVQVESIDDLVIRVEAGAEGPAIHRGRNLLYVVPLSRGEGDVSAVVKRFTHPGWRARLDRRFRRSKAERSWRVARAMVERGVPTPEPLLWIESLDSGGSAMYVCRAHPEAQEARDRIRALNEGTLLDEYPEWRREELVDTVACCARRLHDAGIWHRDFSAGNLLLVRPEGGPPDGLLVDLNRCRVRRRVTLIQRLRDLCRMPLRRSEDRHRLLDTYFGRAVSGPVWRLYVLFFEAFHGRHRLKRAWRRRWRDAIRGPSARSETDRRGAGDEGESA